jgi:hypothetical protein
MSRNVILLNKEEKTKIGKEFSWLLDHLIESYLEKILEKYPNVSPFIIGEIIISYLREAGSEEMRTNIELLFEEIKLKKGEFNNNVS